MKKMDEMDRNIQLRAEERGYRIMVLLLGIWILFNCWQTLAYGAEQQPLPVLILCLSVSVQSFSQIAMKQKMTAGDEEYREPNRLLWTILASIAAVAVILSLGIYFLARG